MGKSIVAIIFILAVLAVIQIARETRESKRRETFYKPTIRRGIRKRAQEYRASKTALVKVKPAYECSLCHGAGSYLATRGGRQYDLVIVPFDEASDEDWAIALDDKERPKAFGRANRILYISRCGICGGSGLQKTRRF